VDAENSVEIYRSSLGGVRSAICEPGKSFCSTRPLMRPLKVRLRFDARARDYQIIPKFGKAWARPSTCRALKSLDADSERRRCSESIAGVRVGGQRLFPGRGSSQARRLRGGGVGRSAAGGPAEAGLARCDAPARSSPGLLAIADRENWKRGGAGLIRGCYRSLAEGRSVE
jgi:hypothetical protein